MSKNPAGFAVPSSNGAPLLKEHLQAKLFVSQSDNQALRAELRRVNQFLDETEEGWEIEYADLEKALKKARSANDGLNHEIHRLHAKISELEGCSPVSPSYSSPDDDSGDDTEVQAVAMTPPRQRVRRSRTTPPASPRKRRMRRL